MRTRDAVLLTAIVFIWGFNFVVIRWGLNHFPPFLFSALRFSVCLVPIAFGVKKPAVSWRVLILLGFTLGLCVFGFLYLGINAGMGAGVASVIMQAQVFFTLLASYVALGERPSEKNLFSIALAIAGLVLIYFSNGTHTPATGFALVLLGALSWGISNTIIKMLPTVDMVGLMVWISLVPPLPLLVLSYWFDDHSMIAAGLTGLDWRGWLAVLYTSFLSTLLAYSVWGTMLQKYPAGKVAPFALLVPVFGLLSAWLFLGSEFSLSDLVGPALIMIALVLNLMDFPSIRPQQKTQEET
ncbi:EamA family transporter [uncultured Hoeflea sp.]|uniref:EamA family transporter n=1 Tax=uncultured Hoeflea sp. TaxID=538666 RepID=UPI0026290A27|nr:EamA family transporter [uncultured Hoeflea sp.]